MIANQIKTVLLLGLLTALLLWVGQLIGGGAGLVIALVFSILINVGSYFFSDKIVLAMYRAKPASEHDYPKLHHMVEDISKRAGIPKPRVYIILTQTPNAFATGRNPKHAVVAATEGILKLLDDRELRGVLAHEIGHVKNRDILITTIAATIAGVISYLASMAQWAAIFGGFGGRDDRDGGGMIQLLVLAIITPLIAMLLQLAISRSREYLADKSGAEYIGNGHALADALEKLERGNKVHPMHHGTPATSSLFIVNPFSGGALLALLSTHPPMDERIKRLRAMKF